MMQRILLSLRHSKKLFPSLPLLFLLFSTPKILQAQQKTTTKPPAETNRKRARQKSPAKPKDELAKLREEFVKANGEYKLSLEKLSASYEKSVRKAEDELIKTRELFAAGLVSRIAVEASEAQVAQAKDKVAEVGRRMADADSQVAAILLEAEAEAKFARKRLRKGSLVSTTAMIRYNGGAVWGLSDAFKVQRFFQDAFKKPLPVAVFGQGAIHDRWRLDHRNAMDVSLHPDSPEGQALLGFLRANGIPFLAFRQAIPGTATGPHIHIGRPSHRY